MSRTVRVLCAANSASISYPDEHQALIPPPGAREEVKPWIHGETLSERLGPVPDDRRVYCNRTMDLSKIEAVGFDMVSLSSKEACWIVSRCPVPFSSPSAALNHSSVDTTCILNW